MANYGGPRFTRPTMNERPGPRFNLPQNRNSPRHNFNDQRPQLNKSNTGPRPAKPPTDTTTSTPPIANQAATALTTNSTDTTNNDPSNKSTLSSMPEASSNQITTESSVDNTSLSKTDTKRPDDQQQVGQKRPRIEGNPSQSTTSFDSTTISFQNNDKKPTQGGRCRLFIGNIPSDLTQEEFQLLFGKYGELVEYFVNPSRGFGFVKLSSRHLAERAKYDLDGYILRGKPLRIRFASQGATVKVKNLSPNVSNELLKEAFEQYFGGVERAAVIVDDRGKSIGEGIIEFEKKPSAQKCLNECTERCFFLTNELKPIIVEPWDIRDEEDGLPEKTLVRNAAYMKERDAKPRFAEMNSIEQTIGLKWKELELQEKQLLEEVKKRMQYATEQVQVEIDQMYLEHQSHMLREELMRRQEDLRRIDELRSQEIDRRRNNMPMHHSDVYNHSYNMSAGNNVFNQNQIPTNSMQYNDFQQGAYLQNPNSLMQSSTSGATPIDAAYTTNQVSRGYVRPGGDDFHHHHHQQQQQQGFDRKRQRY